MDYSLNRNPSLYQPANYQIRIPGALNECWIDGFDHLEIQIQTDHGGIPITTLTGLIDQAALHSVLRRLYSFGLPLISVICLDCVE